MKVDIRYAWSQLWTARQTAASHPDADVRARAAERVASWEAVIAGMSDGSIEIGSRTPTRAPAWVTLEVATGGFATGRYRAGGELADHERAIAARLGVAPSRVALNLHYLESAETDALLASGCYRIDVPEEGALLAVAWLRQRGEVDRAAAVIAAIAPWFDQLRFYPIPAPRPLADPGGTVRLQDVGVTLDVLAVERRQYSFEVMRDAILVWTPLRDRAMALVAEILDADPASGPSAERTARVRALVADRARAGAPASARAKATTALVDQVARYVEDPQTLTAAASRALRRTLDRHIAAHGAPGTALHVAKRAAEQRAVAGPVHAELRALLAARLRDLPRDGGLVLDDVAAPVRDAEARASAGAPVGAAIPTYLVDKLARSWDAPLDALIARRVIPSSETLARVLPQVTAQVRVQAIDDSVRGLYAGLYAAFRRRRGLLLVDYQHQVRFHELPWVAAIEATRGQDDAALEDARRTVAVVSGLAITSFPHTITPNKLVTELSALAAAAALAPPLVEELAADIFMGSFTGKFVAAAHVAARSLAGTLYPRYYGIDPDEVARIPVPAVKTPSAALAALCARRAAAVGSGAGHGVARNGKIIEQAQILTTHNLAVVFDLVGQRDRLAPALRPMAEACFRWVVRQLRIPARGGHEVLLRFKNTAYAWRQMVFYLSWVADLPDFLAWARDQVRRADDAFARRFEPALRGLELAAAGVPSSAPAFAAGGGRVFTGWATERHWLSPTA